MEQFTPQNIAAVLIVIGVLIWSVRKFNQYCDRVDAEWAKRNPPPDSPERQQEIAAQHVAKRTSGHSAQILADMTGLRRDLPPVRNMTGAAQARYPIHQVEQDERMAKALRDATHSPTYYQAEWLQNNPHYSPRGIQNSDEVRRMNARYAGATETEGGHHD